MDEKIERDPELVEDEEYDIDDVEEIDLPDYDPAQFDLGVDYEFDENEEDGDEDDGSEDET